MNSTKRSELSVVAIWAIIVTLPVSMFADETIPLDEIDRFAKASYEARSAALWEATAHLKGLRRRGRRAPRDETKAWEERLSQLEDPVVPFYDRLRWSDGTLGTVKRQVEVVQVVSESEAIVEISSLEIANTRAGGGARRLGTRKGALQEVFTSYYLENYSTKGMIDGRAADIDGLFYMSTRQYPTAIGGTRTIPLLRRVELDEFDEHQDKFTRKADKRTWTMKDGTTVDAIFVRAVKGEVVLAVDEKTTKSIKVTLLSKDDAALVRKLLKPPKTPGVSFGF